MTYARHSNSLFCDQYEFTMLQGYLDHSLEQEAVFELLVRKLPSERNFLIVAGLEQALDYLETLQFSATEIQWLRESGRFRENLLEYLSSFRFMGEVWAMPEGTPCFGNEPILRVKAPLPQAQLIESRLLNLIHFQTVIASKAARSVIAAEGRLLVDFGMRRAHGAEAGLLAARASYLAGFDGTSTVLAGAAFEIPIYGTMAHSYIEVHEREEDAFLSFCRSNPRNPTVLLDTYDTEAAARKLVTLWPRLKEDGVALKGVRLDSGDLAAHAHEVRKILDEGGLQEVQIFASGGLDERRLLELNAAPIDGYGVGTYLTTSEDAPYLDCAYKLQEYAREPRSKRSEGKATIPGSKQVFRTFNERNQPVSDVVGLDSESLPGTPLLEPVMKRGRRLKPPVPLAALRERCLGEIGRLPRELRSIRNPANYPVELSRRLQALARELNDRTAAA